MHKLTLHVNKKGNTWPLKSEGHIVGHLAAKGSIIDALFYGGKRYLIHSGTREHNVYDENKRLLATLTQKGGSIRFPDFRRTRHGVVADEKNYENDEIVVERNRYYLRHLPLGTGFEMCSDKSNDILMRYRYDSGFFLFPKHKFQFSDAIPPEEYPILILMITEYSLHRKREA